MLGGIHDTFSKLVGPAKDCNNETSQSTSQNGPCQYSARDRCHSQSANVDVLALTRRIAFEDDVCVRGAQQVVPHDGSNIGKNVLGKRDIAGTLAHEVTTVIA